MKSLPLKVAQVLTFIALLGTSFSLFILPCFAVISIFSPDGSPMKNATWEIPLKMESEYQPDRVIQIDEAFKATEIEYQRVNLEVLPVENKAFFQGMIYLALFVLVAMGWLILYFLFHVLASIKTDPFSQENLSRIRKIGLLVIGLELYHFFISLYLSVSIGKSVVIEGAKVIPIGWTFIDFGVIFLGIIILVIAEVFRQGFVLQEYENLTV